MAEIVVICFMLGSLAVNIVLARVLFVVLKRFLQLSIAAAPIPMAEKRVLIEKTAPEVAAELPNRRPQDDIVPLGAMGL